MMFFALFRKSWVNQIAKRRIRPRNAIKPQTRDLSTTVASTVAGVAGTKFGHAVSCAEVSTILSRTTP